MPIVSASRGPDRATTSVRQQSLQPAKIEAAPAQFREHHEFARDRKSSAGVKRRSASEESVTVHWGFDGYANSVVEAKATVAAGLNT
jgi:hypothetical protein